MRVKHAQGGCSESSTLVTRTRGRAASMSASMLRQIPGARGLKS